MLATEKVLDYYADVARLGAGPRVDLDALPHAWELPADEMRKGILDASLTRAVQEAQAADHPHDIPGARPIEVVVTLVRACAVGQGREPGLGEPLLLLPALVDAHGHISVRPCSRAFVPHERLASDGARNRTLCVCDLDAYRAHQMAMDRLPKDGSWTSAVMRALDLFHAVSTIDEEALTSQGLTLVEDRSMLALCDDPALANLATPVLSRTARLYEVRGQDALGGPVRAMLAGIVSEGKTTQKDEPAGETTDDSLVRETNASSEDFDLASLDDLAFLEELPDDALLDHKIVSGMAGVSSRLADDGRAALAAFARQTRGDLCVVATPAGTCSSELALGAMANLVCERALRGEPAPLVVCVGCSASLSRLAALLDTRPAFGQTALPTRWLPRIVEGSRVSGLQMGDASGQRVLGSLFGLALRIVADGEGAEPHPSTLVEHLGHAAEGDPARLADGWYVPKATLHFLDCASSFLGVRVRELGEASALLLERLRQVDQLRCELVDAYAEVCRAADHMRIRDGLVERLGRLRRRHAEVRERLATWETLAARHPERRALLGRGVQSQEQLVLQTRTEGEELAEGCETLAEVCARYVAELERIESEIDRLRGTTALLSRRVRAASPEGQRCSQLIARLVGACSLTTAQAEALESVIDGHDTSFGYLNEQLDQTVRAAEFWLAVHAFEAQWLASCRHGMPEGWHAQANLCPFALLTPEVALARLALAGEEQPDLLVLLDADELGAPCGLALLAQARRALVMGTHAELPPLPAFGATSASLHAQALLGDAAEGDGATLANLTLFSAAREASEAALLQLDTVCSSCVEVSDLRSALETRERVVPQVPDATRDAQTRAVSRILSPLSHVLVPDSAWGQQGGSRINRAEALAVVRWIASHSRDLRTLASADRPHPVAVVAPYEAQTHVLRDEIHRQAGPAAELVDVRWLPEARGMSWPVVLLAATCGPESLDVDVVGGTRAVLLSASALVEDALVLFCGGVWAKTPHGAAGSFMRRSLRVGRLFAVARQEQDGVRTEGVAADGLRLHAKPLSLTALLARLVARGEVPFAPPTADVNRALADVGLIERVREPSGTTGWRPTAAGREVGILATLNRDGVPFCSYADAAAPVVASIVSANFSQE